MRSNGEAEETRLPRWSMSFRSRRSRRSTHMNMYIRDTTESPGLEPKASSSPSFQLPKGGTKRLPFCHETDERRCVSSWPKRRDLAKSSHHALYFELAV
ncbi:hypothetical protein GN956_G16678 [Arapaima gigas]